MILSIPLSFTTPPPSSYPDPNPNPKILSYRRLSCRCQRSGDSEWDSSAEPFRSRFRDEDGGGSSNRRWWSDDYADEFEDEFDPFDEESESFWDKFWIFKVFKAYGYMLPAIIASMLLGTGPQAFLMALAFPLGQSAISLAIDKLWGRASEAPRTKSRTKKKPFSRAYNTDFRKQEKEERSSGDHYGTNDYRSWSSADPEVADKESRSRSRSESSGFGGWDELDDRRGSMRRQTTTINRGKLSKRRRYKDTPLLLRLLIAVFPFLGSWTRIL